MRRSGVTAAGVALMLVLGLLVGAAVAQGAELGRCVGTPNGEYANEGCTDQAALPHSGGFEWVAPPSSFTGTGGVLVGEVPSVLAVTTCSSGSATGTITGPKTSQVVDTYVGCESGGAKCHSLNTATAGEIRTFTLEGTLIEHGEKGLGGAEPGPGEVWAEFANQHGSEAPLWDTYQCEGGGYALLKQWLATSVAPLNEMTTSITQDYEGGKGEQSLLSTYCEKSNFTSCVWENQAVTIVEETALVLPEASEIRTNEPPIAPPEAATGAATEVTAGTATVSGFVVPNGEEVVECEFEYGYSEEGPFQSTPCSSLPGKGHKRVQVSAQLSGLTPDSNVFFRIKSRSDETVRGEFSPFTTLQSSVSAETTEATVPAKASDGQLSVEASGGIGGVTIGHYGTAIGGPALANGKGAYFQVYRSPGSTFTKVEYVDCELGGAKTLWWDDPATGWEPITAPTAVYDESTHCITVAVTASSRPSIAQLSDPRHVGGPSASEEYGKCEPAKHAHFKDAGCTEEASFKEKAGARSYKGKYEWLAAPVGCYAQKHGRYSDTGCTSVNEKKGKPKGKYEAGQNTFTASGGATTIDAVGLASVECQNSSSTGTLRAPNESLLQVTFKGCRGEGAECNSAGQIDGTIVTEPLESYTYEEASNYYMVLAGSPITSFSCGHGWLTLSGGAGGQLTTPMNASTSTGEAAFGDALGTQALVLAAPQGAAYPATLTSVLQIADAQATELRTKP